MTHFLPSLVTGPPLRLLGAISVKTRSLWIRPIRFGTSSPIRPGRKIRFWGFTGVPDVKKGQFYSYTDPGGNETRVVPELEVNGKVGVVRRTGTINGTSVTEDYTYTYEPTPDYITPRIASVTLTRNGASIRSVSYAYYDASNSNGNEYGNEGDLKTATVKDLTVPAEPVIDTYYYRYYKGGDGGYQHGLMYALGPAAFARTDNDYADDTTTAPEVGAYD